MAIQKVTTLALEDNSVTEPKVAAGALTDTDIGANAITNTKIANNAVTTAKLDSTGIAPVITGGTINGASIGATTPASVAATNLSASGTVNFTNALGVAYGGTGGNDQASARSGLGLGSAATQNTTAFEPANANIQNHISSTSNPHSVTANQVLPDQTGLAGKALVTDGSNVSWGNGGLSAARVYFTKFM